MCLLIGRPRTELNSTVKTRLKYVVPDTLYLSVVKYSVVCYRVFSHKVTLGVVGVVEVLVADAPNFEGPKVPNFVRYPLVVCFRTKSDFHPLRTQKV